MVEMNLFHFRDRKTFLNRTHPLAKTVALLVFSTLMARSDLGRIVVILAVFCLVALSISIPLGSYRRELRFFMVMATIIGVARAVGAESWQDPATAVLRFAAIVLMGLLFADTTAPGRYRREPPRTASRYPRVSYRGNVGAHAVDHTALVRCCLPSLASTPGPL